MPIDDPSALKGAAAPRAVAASISLNQAEGRVGVVSEMEKALVRGVNADTIARVVMVLVIAAIFVGLNWAVIAFLRTAFDHDIALLTAGIVKVPADRVITTNVFMSLIGATVVQVGVAIIAIVNYLFPKKAVSPTVGSTS